MGAAAGAVDDAAEVGAEAGGGAAAIAVTGWIAPRPMSSRTSLQHVLTPTILPHARMGAFGGDRERSRGMAPR
eukprot:10422013-Alexandrium_andersonii.AAC.1